MDHNEQLSRDEPSSRIHPHEENPSEDDNDMDDDNYMEETLVSSHLGANIPTKDANTNGHHQSMEDQEESEDEEAYLGRNNKTSPTESDEESDGEEMEKTKDGTARRRDEEAESEAVDNCSKKEHDGDDGIELESDNGEGVEEQEGDDKSEGSESNSSEESSSSEDDDENQEAPVDGNGAADPANPQLSDYEKLRLERIQRNQRLLAQLGLEDNRLKKQQKKRPSSAAATKKEAVPRRSRLSRRSKQRTVRYSEESSDALVQPDAKKKEDKDTKENDNKAAQTTADPDTCENEKQVDDEKGGVANAKEKERQKELDEFFDNRKKKRDPSARMDGNIYREFQRIKSEKRLALKRAQRDARYAEKEVRYWQRLVHTAEKREQRKLEILQRNEEKTALGVSSRELLQEIDRRYAEITMVVRKYDEPFEVVARQQEYEARRREDERKAQLIRALDRYPRAIRDATTVLNAVLVERAPKDPPPPRRSKRTADELEGDKDTATVEKPKKKANRGRPKKADKDDEEGTGHWSNVPEADADLPAMEDVGEKPGEGGAKKRKKMLRNVGGWIAPEFAAKIDRAWLNNDTQPQELSLYRYVPQVGDAVLYYPIGHAAFLAEYPDILGKKMRQVSRIPLWERGGEHPWLTDDWKKGVASGEGGHAPILCLVQATWPEFPPDQMKFGKKKKKGDNEHGVSKRKSSSSKLRLAVNLRPLTAIYLQNDSKLPVPPIFSIVTFPSSLRPFLVPFAWSYSVSHTVTVGRQVQEKHPHGRYGEVVNLDAVGVSTKNLKEKISAIKKIQKRFGKGAARKTNLASSFPSERGYLPLPDALTALETMASFDNGENEIEESSDESSLFDLIRISLPVWDSVEVKSTVQGDENFNVSPWDIVPMAERSSKTPLKRFLYSIDDSLRVRLDHTLREILRENAASVSFMGLVTDEIAPSYSCAVPVPMYFDRILKRLRARDKHPRCFYRSVGSLMADITAILENCLLYNNPDSELVNSAIELIGQTKEAVAKIVKMHNKELSEIRKADEQRQKLVLLHCSSANGEDRDDSSVEKLVTTCRIKDPFKQEIYEDWLQQTTLTLNQHDHQDKSRPPTPWIPQSGDHVLYSRDRHAKFVMEHYPSLETAQCNLPSFDEPTSNATESAEKENAICSDWVKGVVSWTRACFPKLPSRKSDEDALTFGTNSTLLALGIRFEKNEALKVIYWRPCLFNFETWREECPSCGLSTSTSFLQFEQNSSLTISESQTLEKCLSLLKRKCIRGVPPSSLDPQLTKASVMTGCTPTQPKLGVKSLPTFHELLVKKTSKKTSGTRKQGAKQVNFDPNILRYGYIPSWLLELVPQNQVRRHETISPWPSLCLELIRARLECHFYRHKTAIENDIVEAYSSISFLLLSEPAMRKKNPVSVKRVARLAGASRSKDDTKGEEAQEEESLASSIKAIRDLHAAALTCVTDIDVVDKLHGITVPVSSESETRNQVLELPRDPIKEQARNALGHVLSAVGRDMFLNTFHGCAANSISKRTLKIVAGGQLIKHEKFCTKLKRLTAFLDDKDFSVRVIFNSKEFAYDIDAPVCNRAPAEFHGETVDVSVLCDGDEISVPPPGIAIHTKLEDRIVFEEADFERDEMISKIFFGRPGRRNACARCHAYRRSMLSCRARRSHSNCDFNWIEFFKEVGSLDNLLIQLDPLLYRNQAALTEPVVENRDHEVSTSGGGLQPPPSETLEAKKGDEPEGKVPEVNGDDTVGTSKKEEPVSDQLQNIDFRVMLEKAKQSLKISKDVLKQAESFSVAPGRLDREFIEQYFPVDQADGHYIYCIICGLSGNLLCCDGCANVVHASCVNLTAVPDGEWFCEECEVKKKSDQGAVDLSGQLPFQRFHFDEKRAKDLSQIIHHLQEAHPERKIRRQENDNDNDNDNEAEPDSTDVQEKPIEDPISVLTQTPTAFLNSMGIKTAQELISWKTADLAKMFAEWRKENGMAELKGVGVNVSVSTWKRSVRDAALEVGVQLNEQVSKVIWKDDEESEAEESEEDDASDVEWTKSRRRSSVKARPSADSEGGDPIDVLSDMAKEFFRSVDVNSFAEFSERQTSELAKRFAKWRKRKKLPELRGSGCTATISSWRTACRNAQNSAQKSDVDEKKKGINAGTKPEEEKKRKDSKTKPEGEKKRKDTKTKPEEEKKRKDTKTKPEEEKKRKNTRTKPEEEKKMKDTNTQASLQRSKRAQRRSSPERKSTGMDDEKEGNAVRRQGVKRKRESRQSKDSDDEDSSDAVGDDALDALTDLAREFLTSIGVEDAEDFLSRRTKDLGSALGEWRTEKGLSKLRGSGNGATISAWRTLCRKQLQKIQLRNKKQKFEESDKDDSSKEISSPPRRVSNGHPCVVNGDRSPAPSRDNTNEADSSSDVVLMEVEEDDLDLKQAGSTSESKGSGNEQTKSQESDEDTGPEEFEDGETEQASVNEGNAETERASDIEDSLGSEVGTGE